MTSSLLLGLIGDGISASRTPRMHENEGTAHSIPTIYRTIDVTEPKRADASLDELLTAAIRLGFNGLNITHPFKQQVIDLLDEVDPVAARIDSVNTVVIDETGSTKGFNTDVTGFAAGFRAGLDGAATEAVVQIGAGGAGRAVGFALAELGVGELIIADTDVERAAGLATDIGRVAAVRTRARAIGLDELEGGGRLGEWDRQRHPGRDEGLPGNPRRHDGLRGRLLDRRRRLLPA
jgi:shikimate dehydrogenase